MRTKDAKVDVSAQEKTPATPRNRSRTESFLAVSLVLFSIIVGSAFVALFANYNANQPFQVVAVEAINPLKRQNLDLTTEEFTLRGNFVRVDFVGRKLDRTKPSLASFTLINSKGKEVGSFILADEERGSLKIRPREVRSEVKGKHRINVTMKNIKGYVVVTEEK